MWLLSAVGKSQSEVNVENAFVQMYIKSHLQEYNLTVKLFAEFSSYL